MSWTSDNAMEQVVENCIKGYSCTDVAKRWIEKQIGYYAVNDWNTDELKEQLDALQKNGE